LFVIVGAQPASGVSQRTVTIALFGNGKALWKLNNNREKSRVSLEYHWHGVLRFVASDAVLRDPSHKHLSAESTGALVASWSGNYTSSTAGRVATCEYGGAKVKAPIRATLAKGRAGNTLEVRFHPRLERGFFSDKGRRAFVRCSAGFTQSAPAHFAPSWFFRDNLQDHGRLSSDTAIIVLPSTLLPSGKATVAFPDERGRNNSVAVGRIAWNNRAETAVRAQ
jgi:hypothetical protein